MHAWLVYATKWEGFSTVLRSYREHSAGGGPAIPRPVLPTCGKLRVEVRPLTLQAFRWPDIDKAKPLQISRQVSHPRRILVAP